MPRKSMAPPRLPSSVSLTGPLAVCVYLLHVACAQHASAQAGVLAEGNSSFALHGHHMSYRLHVDPATGDLVGDHFGALAHEAVPAAAPAVNGWVGLPGRARREFPDLGRGDFRSPAVRVRQAAGYAVSDLRYRSHELVAGKPPLAGLPALAGAGADAATLVVRLWDNYSAVAADLTYTVFPAYDAVVRSVNITNLGEGDITVEKLASFSVDLPYADLDMIGLRGDWARENTRTRRKVEYGTQGFGSTAGYSSHLHNPFFALVAPSTTESQGEAWGFSLVYSGSFQAEVERGSQGLTRALLGLHPDLLSWPLAPGETLTSPEVVAVYSDQGVGGLSRAYHRLYRNHLIPSAHGARPRPPLLNSWEGLGFDYNQSTLYDLAVESAALGVQLFVLDDGWFGEEYPRVNDTAGLGDWVVNKAKFPSGSLAPLVEQVTNLTAGNTTTRLRFGLWFEPEMVSPHSALYRAHPDWVLAAGPYPRTETRSELVLDASRRDVQDFMVEAVSRVLRAARGGITYVKWDANRGVHETAAPAAGHAHVLGLYRVLGALTARFPGVLWEGCASGGGRLDPGALRYFPQVWASDNTDALARLAVQFGASLVYPPSALGAHVSAVPNAQTGRTIPVGFRAHVAMMGGSFGLELDPTAIPDADRAALPGLIDLAGRVGPLVVGGDLWRLALPGESDWPAALFLSEDGARGVLFLFQVRAVWNQALPYLRLQGLDPRARYRVHDGGAAAGAAGAGAVGGAAAYAGATLMGTGLQFSLQGDYNSTIVFIDRL